MFEGLVNRYGLGVVLNATNNMSREFKRAASDLDTLREKTSLTGKELERESKRMQKSMDAAARGIKSSLAMMGAGLAGLGLTGFLAKQSAESERNMTTLAAAYRATGMSAAQAARFTEYLDKQIKSLTGTTVISQREMEEAAPALVPFRDMQLAGDALKRAVDLRRALNATLPEGIDAVRKTFNAYGTAMGDVLTPSQKMTSIANMLALASARFNVPLAELSAGLENVAPLATQFGVSLDKVLTYLLQATVRTGSFSAAASGFEQWLRSVSLGEFKFANDAQKAVRSLTEASVDMSTRIEGSKKKDVASMILGIPFTDAKGQLRNVEDWIKDAEKVTGYKAGQPLSAKIMQAMNLSARGGGVEFMTALIGQSSAMDSLNQELNTYTGLADAATTKEQGLSAATIRLRENLGKFNEMMGDPILSIAKLVNGLNSLISSVNEFGANNPTLIKIVSWGFAMGSSMLFLRGAIRLVTFAIGPLIKMLGFAGGFSGLAGAFGMGGTGLAAFTSAMAGIAPPIIAGALAISGLYAVLKPLADLLDEKFTKPRQTALASFYAPLMMPGPMPTSQAIVTPRQPAAKRSVMDEIRSDIDNYNRPGPPAPENLQPNVDPLLVDLYGPKGAAANQQVGPKTVHDYSTYRINIQQQPGESADTLARRLLERIEATRLTGPDGVNP